MLITGLSSRSSLNRFIKLIPGLELLSIDLQSVCCLRTGSRKFIKSSEDIVILDDQILKFVSKLVKKLLLVVF